jgi:hypothetical protein
MSFFAYHRFGASERDPPVSAFPLLLDELEGHPEDQDHSSVSIIHESEWGLGFSKGGYVTFEHVEGEGEPRHMIGVSRQKQLAMMELLAKGDLAALERELWRPGYLWLHRSRAAAKVQRE